MRKLLSGCVALLLAGALLYAGACLLASLIARQQLEQILQDNQLEQHVHWQSLRSSPLGGTLTLNGVHWQGNAGLPVELHIRQLRLHDLVHTESRLAFRLEVEHLQPQSPADPLLLPLYQQLQITPGPAAEPLNARLELDYALAQGSLALELAVELPGLLDAAVSVELDQIRTPYSLLLAATASGLQPAPLNGNWLLDRALADARAIRLRSLQLSYQDRGRALRAIQPQPPLHCPPQLAQRLSDPDQTCRQLLAAWQGLAPGFVLQFNPAPPLPLGQIATTPGAAANIRSR